MARNLDITSLRSFVAIADLGGVTRAAAQLHLTQSAVSMQLKRLEEALGMVLFDRSNRKLILTAQGELLLSFARRIIELNDEAWGRLTGDGYEGEIVLGVPHDIVYPHVPNVLKRFTKQFPRIQVNLISSFTLELKQHLSEGKADIILATEKTCPEGATILSAAKLRWFGAKGGSAYKARPLRLAYEEQCLFKPYVIDALDSAGIDWSLVVDTRHARTVDASVSADLAIHACLETTQPDDWQEIPPAESGLPELSEFLITMQVAPGVRSEPVMFLADLLGQAYLNQDTSAGIERIRAI